MHNSNYHAAIQYKIGFSGTEPSSLLFGADEVYPMGCESTVHVSGYDAITYINFRTDLLSNVFSLVQEGFVYIHLAFSLLDGRIKFSFQYRNKYDEETGTPCGTPLASITK